MSAKESDALLDQLYKLHTADGIGGDMRFVDAFFSFLRRRTLLLNKKESVEKVQGLALKHVQAAEKDLELRRQKKKELDKVAAEKKAAEEDEDMKDATTAGGGEKPVEETGPALVGNGGTTDRYMWTQTLGEVQVHISVPAHVKGKDLTVELSPEHCKVVVRGQKPLIEQDWHEKIDSDQSTWTLDQEKGKDTKTLSLFIPKANKMHWWKTVLKGDPEIDSTKIVPENSQLSDLDGDTRQTVEKMMFDQRQKAAGKPTSDEMKKQEALAKFMKMHPEMDFSKAKIS